MDFKPHMGILERKKAIISPKPNPQSQAWEREMLHIFIVSPSAQQYTATGKHNY